METKAPSIPILHQEIETLLLAFLFASRMQIDRKPAVRNSTGHGYKAASIAAQSASMSLGHHDGDLVAGLGAEVADTEANRTW